MPIDTLCPNCGRLIYAPEEAADGEVLCPGCEAVVRVADSARFWLQRQAPIALACPVCDAPVRVAPRLVGMRVRCNTCQAVLFVSLSLTRADDVEVVSAEPVEPHPDRRDDQTESDPPAQGTPPPLPAGIRQSEPRGNRYERRSKSDGSNGEFSVAIRPGSSRKRRRAAPVAPWFWPSVVALAATLLMLLALAMITFVA